MTPAPLPCLEDGCPRAAVKQGRCDQHWRDRRRQQDRRRPNARARGYDERWRRTRGGYLAAHPCCEQLGCSEPATDVHHVDGKGPLGPHGHDPRNLAALCHSHHSEATAALQPGGWNR